MITTSPDNHHSLMTIGIMATNQVKPVFTAANLRKKARAAQGQKAESRKKADAERAAAKTVRLQQQADLLEQVTAKILAEAMDPSFQQLAAEKAEKEGYDAVCIWKCFLPTSLKTQTADGLVVEHLVPQEHTYVCRPGEDLDTQGVPLALLMQGPFVDGLNRPDQLPGKKTVVDLLNEAAKEHLPGFSFDLQLGRSKEFKNARNGPAKVLRLYCIWDQESYAKRLTTFKKQQKAREEKRAQQQEADKLTMTMDEYKRRAKPATDSDGFQQARPRRRQRKE